MELNRSMLFGVEDLERPKKGKDDLFNLPGLNYAMEKAIGQQARKCKDNEEVMVEFRVRRRTIKKYFGERQDVQ